MKKEKTADKKPSWKKLTKKQIIIAVLALLLVLVLAIAAIPASELLRTTSRPGTDVTVTIERGSSAQQIGELLAENGVIDSVFLFKLKVRMMDKTAELNYGTFNLNTGMSMTEVVEAISERGYGEVTFTVPEGYSVEMIAKKLEEKEVCTEKEFLDALGDEYDYAFLDAISENTADGYKLQGFLFPDTYYFMKNTSAHTVVDTMLGQFEEKCKGLNLIGEEYTITELVTIASLIEKEAKIATERPIIAGVIYNRLEIDMPLQIDASVLFCVTDGLYDKNVVTVKDLDVKSAYNTYQANGLPPGPICNPGLASIEAALNPQVHEYYYYHTDTVKNDGSHIFTKTLDEHIATMS